MLISITDYVDELHKYLRTTIPAYGLASKTDDTPGAGFAGAPHIYDYTMPATALKGDYPSECPAIVIRIDSQQDNTFTISLCICVAYGAEAEADVAYPVPEQIGLYEFDREAPEYDTGADVALLKTSILYTERVVDAVRRMTVFSVENVVVELPSPGCEDFPFAISTVTFDVPTNRRELGQSGFDDLY